MNNKLQKNLITGIFLAVTLLGCNGQKDKKNAVVDNTIKIQVTAAKLSLITSNTTQVGTVKAFEESKVSSKVSGKVVKIYVQEGDPVGRGRTLCVLDQMDLSAQLNQANAGLGVAKAGLNKVVAGSREENIEQAKSGVRQAKANFENAKVNFDRTYELYKKSVIPKQSYDTAETQYKVSKESLRTAQEQLKMLKSGATKEDILLSKAQVNQARSNVDVVRQQLNNTYVTSPFSGVVAQKLVNLGEVISPTTPLFNIVQMDTVRIRVDLAESLIKYFSKGKESKIKLDAYPDKIFTGTIGNISPIVNVQSRTFWVEIFVSNPQHVIKPGMFARVTFNLETHAKVLTVPLESVINKGESKYVYIVKDNIASLSPRLNTGITTNSQVEILYGLKEGDQVAIKGIENLVDKAKVKVIK